jgi:hypothetical protein
MADYGKWSRCAAIIGCAALALAVAAGGCGSEGGQSAVTGGGKVVGPDRSAALAATKLPALDAPAKALDQYKGKAGLLAVFVDTSCPFAATAVGGVDAAAKALAPYNLPVVLVNLDDRKAAVDAYYKKNAVHVPVMYDTTTVTKQRWQVTRVPTIVLLDAAGRESYNGKCDWPKVSTAVEQMLNLKPNSVKIGAASTGGT